MNKRRIRLFIFVFLFIFNCFGIGTAETFSGTLVIPQGTKSIEAEAFCNTQGITEVILPDGIEQIGQKAFAGSGLSRIILPSSLRSIADNALDLNAGIEVLAFEDTYAYNWALEHDFAPKLLISSPLIVPAAVRFPKNISELSDMDEKLDFQFPESEDKGNVEAVYPLYRIYAWYNAVTGRLSTNDDIFLDNQYIDGKEFDFILNASYAHQDQTINRCFLNKSYRLEDASVEMMDYYHSADSYFLERVISTAAGDEVYYYSTSHKTTSIAGSANTTVIPAKKWMYIVVEDGMIVSCEEAQECIYTQKIADVVITGTLDILCYPQTP